MQTKRTPSQVTPVAKKAPVTPPRHARALRAPLELDVQSLRHVAGGATEGPKGGW